MTAQAMYLAVAAYGWARKPTRKAAEAAARKNVPSFVRDKRVFTVLEVTANAEGEWPWIDQMGDLRVPVGATWTTVYERSER